jgi:hypothetical protein
MISHPRFQARVPDEPSEGNHKGQRLKELNKRGVSKHLPAYGDVGAHRRDVGRQALGAPRDYVGGITLG